MLSAQSMEQSPMYKGNAYMIMTDLHDSFSSAGNRYNYPREISHCKRQIIKVAQKYIDEGYNTFLISLGDWIDRGYKSINGSINSNNFAVTLNLMGVSCFSLVGNHELSYYKDNPFWSMVSSIESSRIERVKNKVWSPKGILPLVRVVDRIDDGNVSIYFNHYDTGIQPTERERINIGLFHQDICTKAIIDSMRAEGRDIFETGAEKDFQSANILGGYDYAFLGHMHKIYGRWNYVNDTTKQETVLTYLASLGRPNHTEVQNNFLERNIPVIIVEDEKFIRIDDNKFDLMKREDCVDDAIVEKQQEAYESVKVSREIKRHYQSITDDPIRNIKENLSNDNMNIIIDCILENGKDSLFQELEKELDKYEY